MTHTFSLSIPAFSFEPLTRPTRATLFPYTTLFRSPKASQSEEFSGHTAGRSAVPSSTREGPPTRWQIRHRRSEEHTSELQSRENLVCRLLLEKKKQPKIYNVGQ